jgi:hypothetical protein
MKGDAKFSACGRWRWWLTRIWDESLSMACLIGMNPSTASATENDPTISKEIHYVRSWGFGGMLKLNAYAYCTAHPVVLYAARARGVDVIGAENTISHLARYIREFGVRKTVACWGRLKTDRGWLLQKNLGVDLDCFKRNTDGSPAHPLYLPYGLLPEPWYYGQVSPRDAPRTEPNHGGVDA